MHGPRDRGPYGSLRRRNTKKLLQSLFWVSGIIASTAFLGTVGLLAYLVGTGLVGLYFFMR